VRKIILDIRRKKKISAQDFKKIVKKEADRTPPDLNSWFDMWHSHVDWEGDGNLSRIHRQIQLWAVFRTLRKFQNLTRYNKSKYQIFAYVHENEPENDAVYIHTENPNNSAFPCDLTVASWLTEIPFWLSRHISIDNYNVGLNEYEGEKYYLIHRK
jgi:hypothetical protein